MVSVSPRERNREEMEVCRRLEALTLLFDAGSVLAFWPVGHEPDITPIISILKRKGKTVYLPVVTSFARTRQPEESRIGMAKLEESGDLEMNRWGIPEPPGALVRDRIPDVVLVPALAVDRVGNRLGHGFGYYDELLDRLGKPSICPVFSCQLVDSLPSEPHDVQLSVIITPREVIPKGFRA